MTDIAPFAPQHMPVGVLTAALQELTPRQARDDDRLRSAAPLDGERALAAVATRKEARDIAQPGRLVRSAVVR